MLLQKGNQFFDTEVGEFEVADGHGWGRGQAKDLFHSSEGLTVAGDVDVLVFVAVFLQVGFNFDTPRAAGFYVNSHHVFEGFPECSDCPADSC